MCEKHNDQPIRYTFDKSERLCSKKEIQELFDNGSSFYEYPLRIKYIPIDETTQVLFTVPKKNFKRAVDRNRLKRLLRESYRLNKLILENGRSKGYILGFIYASRTIHDFEFVQKKVTLVLNRLVEETNGPI